jgi:hypothetical protein
MTEKQLIRQVIEEFHYSGRTNEHIARVLHLPLEKVEEEVKNIVFSPQYLRS